MFIECKKMGEAGLFDTHFVAYWVLGPTQCDHTLFEGVVVGL